jgi:CheY-like chemotaxis protein/anti-sigma regulatory factor (Ser/Thr protein kinase)
LHEIILLFTDKAKSKGLELKCLIEPNFPSGVMLDEIRIKQVLFNLVGNALKFTHEGHVSINLSFNNANAYKGQIQIVVEDSGIGIPESQFQLIFEAFRQQFGQSDLVYGGSGLGLAISKRLVEKMNGTISVNSIAGKGSAFTVVLPDIEICFFGPRQRNYLEDYQQVTFEGATILVVDDVISNIETVENLLYASGLTIISAQNGEIALEILNHTSPSLILLDIRMPGIDGFEVAKRIKADENIKHIPVIAFTATVMSSTSIEYSQYFDGVIFKPVKRFELYTMFMKFLKYSIADQDVKPEGMMIPKLPLLSAENAEKLPEILKILKDKFLPEWEKIKDTLILFKIEAFAHGLKEIANEYSFSYLTDYADKIQEDLEIVDLEAIKVTLAEFPMIINNLSKFLPGNQS